MRKYVILAGNATDAGNFSAYTSQGERIHVHAKQLESAGIDVTKDITFPLFATGETRQIGQLDASGEPVMEDGVAVTVDRLTAGAIFKDRVSFVDALAQSDERLLDAEINQAVGTIAKASGLNAESLSVITNASATI